MLEQPQQPKVFVEGNTASFPTTILAQSFPLVQDITTGSPSFGNFIFTHYAYRQRQANVSLTWVCACARYRGCATVGFSSLYAAGWQWTWPKASSAGGSERMQIYLGAVADLQMNLLRSPLSLSLSLSLPGSMPHMGPCRSISFWNIGKDFNFQTAFLHPVLLYFQYVSNQTGKSINLCFC